MQGAVIGESQARFIDEKPQACYHGSQCKMFNISELVGNFVGGEISSIVKLICRSKSFQSKQHE